MPSLTPLFSRSGWQVPYLGVCLGMQVAVIEYARNVVGLQDANSTEFNEQATHPVVIFMPEGSKVSTITH